MTNVRTSHASCMWIRMALLFVALVLPGSLYAQSGFQQVSGTVVDELNQPLPGVNVVVAGTSVGTATDIDGHYTLMSVPSDGRLTFTSMGYKEKTISVSGQTVINCSLEEDVQKLEDVVVIGYQSITREKSTAAISSVTSEKLENIPVPSVEMALQGKVAGLNIMNISGEPGSKGIVTLRGNTNVASQDARSTPLYVIDGVVMDENDLGDVDLTGTNPIAGINPNDIESIDVLKDASASAIYGARAANGVILITTKTPKSARPQVRLNAYYGVSNRPTLRDISVGKAERNSKINLVGKYFGYETNEWAAYNQFTSYNDGISYWVTDSLNPSFNNNTDWQGLIFRGARIQNYDVSVSQRIDKMGYRISYNYYDEEGTMIGTGFNRNVVSLNLTLNPFKWMNIVSNIRFNEMRRTKSYGDLNVFTPWGMPSSFWYLTDEDIKNFSGSGAGRMDKNLNRDLTANIQLMLDFSKDFKWTTSYTYALDETKYDYFIPSYSNGGTSYANSSYASQRRWEVENFLQYLHSFNDKHNLSVLVGQGAEYAYVDATNAWGYDAASDDIKTIQGIADEDLYSSSTISERSRVSVFARASYDFKDKYLVSLNWRVDGSSRFGAKNRWGHFPSASAGWILTKEKWFPENIVTDFLKVRASYGITGNDPAGYYDTYTAMTASISNGSKTTTSYAGENAVAYDYGATVSSHKLGWEQSRQMNFGLDAHFFNKRLIATAEYYIRDSENLIYSTSLPVTTGYTSAQNNIASVRNQGYELTFSLDLLPRNSDWMLTIDMNVAHNKNEVKSLPYNNRSVEVGASWMLYTLEVGRPLYEFKAYKANGIYSTYDDIPVDPLTGKYMQMCTGWGLNEYYDGSQSLVQLQPGCTDLEDVNGDYIIDMYDKKSYGCPDPVVYGGLQAMLRWKDISASMYCAFTAGRKVWNGYLSDRLNGGNWGGEYAVGHWGSYSGPAMDFGGLSFWTEEGDHSDLPTIYPYSVGGTYYDLYNIASGLFLDNGTFFRIKNLSLSYDFPSDLISKIKLQRLRVYAYMDNVKLWKKSKTLADPENVDASGYTRGDEYPLPHKYTFGLEVTF